MTKLMKFVLATLLTVAFAGTAHAAASTKSGCIVTKVGAGDSRIFVDCGGQSFYGNVGCLPMSSDLVKSVVSLTTSALLSGKKMNITFEAGTSCQNAIYSVDLFAN